MLAMLLKFDMAFDDSPEMMSSRNDGMSVLRIGLIVSLHNKQMFVFFDTNN